MFFTFLVRGGFFLSKIISKTPFEKTIYFKELKLFSPTKHKNLIVLPIFKYLRRPSGPLTSIESPNYIKLDSKNKQRTDKLLYINLTYF
jgi:hypothetical protein